MVDGSFHSTLRAVRANAEWAWQALYDAHAPRVLQYLRSQGAPDPEAVLSESFLRVVRSISTFEGDEDAFRGWLFRIVQHCLIDARRAHRSTGELDVDAIAAERDVAEQAEERSDEARAYDMLRALPRDQRAVVFMRVALDLSIAEVAAILGRRESAVKMLQQRGLNTLRERMIGSDDA